MSWRVQVVINEEYRPSRRSIAPRADRGRASYSARTLALYFAENCRRPKDRSGTSGSGGVSSSIAPAWWRVSSRWLIVVVMGEVPSPPFSSLICQGKPSHSRLTQRATKLWCTGLLGHFRVLGRVTKFELEGASKQRLSRWPRKLT